MEQHPDSPTPPEILPPLLKCFGTGWPCWPASATSESGWLLQEQHLPVVIYAAWKTPEKLSPLGVVCGDFHTEISSPAFSAARLADVGDLPPAALSLQLTFLAKHQIREAGWEGVKPLLPAAGSRPSPPCAAASGRRRKSEEQSGLQNQMLTRADSELLRAPK